MPGVTINMGKQGINSISIGKRGLHYTVGRNGRERVTVGLPGSGLYLTDERRRSTTDSNNFSWPAVTLLLFAAVALLALIN